MSLIYDFVKPLNIWTHFGSFFYKVSKGGPKEKCWKTNWQFFSIFPLVPPWKLWKKSCLNELKFWEASRNHKSSLPWKLHNSILKNAKTSQLSASISEEVVPLFEMRPLKIVLYRGIRTIPGIVLSEIVLSGDPLYFYSPVTSLLLATLQ